MEPESRLSTISYLLRVALDDDEEYVYEGEMSYYPRTYAADAASDLERMFRDKPPTRAELECCVAALSNPDRIERGKSRKVLLWIRDGSEPILDAMAGSPDPRIRIFALETGSASRNPLFWDPIYTRITLTQRLLDDPDENVRAAAVAVAQQIIVRNASYIRFCLERGDDTPMVDFLRRVAARLDDPAPVVRSRAEEALRGWAAEVDPATVEMFVGRGGGAAAREILKGEGTEG